MSQTAPRLHGNRSPATPASGPRRPSAAMADNVKNLAWAELAAQADPEILPLRLAARVTMTVATSRCARSLPARSERKRVARARKTPSFHLDHSPGLGELLPDGLRLFLGDAFLDGLGSAIHQVLGLLQAQAGDFAHRLDDIDLIRAHFLEHDAELGLLLGRSRTRRRPCAAAGHDHRRGRGRGNAQALLQLLDQLRRIQQRQPYDLLFQLLQVSHCYLHPSVSVLLFGTVCPVSSALSNPAAPDSRQEPGSQPLAPDNQIPTRRRLSHRRTCSPSRPGSPPPPGCGPRRSWPSPAAAPGHSSGTAAWSKSPRAKAW